MGGLAWRFVVAVRVRPCPLVAAALSGSIDAKGDTGSLHAARMQAKALVCRARLSSVSRGPAKSSPISPMNRVVRASSQNRASSVSPTRPSAIHQLLVFRRLHRARERADARLRPLSRYGGRCGCKSHMAVHIVEFFHEQQHTTAEGVAAKSMKTWKVAQR